MKFKSAMLVFALLALLSTSVMAQEEDEGPTAQEKAALDMAEKKATLAFSQADADKDGKLSKYEFENAKPMKGKSFETYDTNGDSTMTLEEYKAGEMKKK